MNPTDDGQGRPPQLVRDTFNVSGDHLADFIPELTPSEWKVYGVIVCNARHHHGRSGRTLCMPDQRPLNDDGEPRDDKPCMCGLTKLSKRAVELARKGLEEKGLIDVVEHGDNGPGRGQWTIYELRFQPRKGARGCALSKEKGANAKQEGRNSKAKRAHPVAPTLKANESADKGKPETEDEHSARDRPYQSAARTVSDERASSHDSVSDADESRGRIRERAIARFEVVCRIQYRRELGGVELKEKVRINVQQLAQLFDEVCPLGHPEWLDRWKAWKKKVFGRLGDKNPVGLIVWDGQRIMKGQTHAEKVKADRGDESQVFQHCELDPTKLKMLKDIYKEFKARKMEGAGRGAMDRAAKKGINNNEFFSGMKKLGYLS